MGMIITESIFPKNDGDARWSATVILEADSKTVGDESAIIETGSYPQ